MSELIQAVVVGADRVAERLTQTQSNFVAALGDGIGRAVLSVQARVKDKLSDDVLRVKTGRLRRSITEKVTASGDRVEGIVGTNVEYAPIHEYGFIGKVSVRESLRTSKLGRVFSVSAHERQVDMPERSFLRSALTEMQPEIRALIERTVSDHILKAAQS